MQNKLSDLNNHLFAQLERLGDESLTDEQLTAEFSRAKAITEVSKQIIDNGSLVLKAYSAAYNAGRDVEVPVLLLPSEE